MFRERVELWVDPGDPREPEVRKVLEVTLYDTGDRRRTHRSWEDAVRSLGMSGADRRAKSVRIRIGGV